MVCDHQMTALYQLQKKMLDATEALEAEIGKKADNLVYDKDSRDLQLVSGETTIGDAVRVPSDGYADKIAEAVEDTWSDMDDTIDDGAGEWETM